MKRGWVVFMLAALSSMVPGMAHADDTGLEELQQSSIPVRTVRQETLELPGLTACHQCEWRPKMNKMAAGEQCGTGADGTARFGQFECGFSPDCQRVCNFMECTE